MQLHIDICLMANKFSKIKIASKEGEEIGDDMKIQNDLQEIECGIQ